MNRSLLLALAVVGGVSLYLSNQSDDELLAPSRQSGGKPVALSGQRAQVDEPSVKANMSRAVDRRSAVMDVWLAEGLTQGVARWQARSSVNGEARSDKGDPSAWLSVQPPPPPRVAVVEPPPPPPPPMAPRFPHAWVGRFNDDVVPQAAHGASAPVPQIIARAVLVGPQSTWVVRAGDVIEGQWRIDRIQDRTMSLTYLPLKQQQTVVMR